MAEIGRIERQEPHQTNPIYINSINPPSGSEKIKAQGKSKHSLFDGRTIKLGFYDDQDLTERFDQLRQNPYKDFLNFMVNITEDSEGIILTDEYVQKVVENMSARFDSDSLLISSFSKLVVCANNIVEADKEFGRQTSFGLCTVNKKANLTGVLRGNQEIIIISVDGNKKVLSADPSKDYSVVNAFCNTKDKVYLCPKNVADFVEPGKEDAEIFEYAKKLGQPVTAFELPEEVNKNLIGIEPASVKYKENISELSKENFMLSQQFERIFQKCPNRETQEQLIGLTTTLLKFTKSDNQLKFVQELLSNLDLQDIYSDFFRPNERAYEIYTDYLIKLIEHSSRKSFNNLNDALDIAIDIFMGTDGVFYHGTNAVAAKKIAVEGLHRGDRDYDATDMEMIVQIFEQVSATKPWYQVSDKKFYLATDPRTDYGYAINSPEWFAEFTKPYSGGPYALTRRDYVQAQKNIEETIQRLSEPKVPRSRLRPLSASEVVTIRSFFEKYWQVFATTQEASLLSVQLEKPSELLAIISLMVHSQHRIARATKNYGSLNEGVEYTKDRLNQFIEDNGGTELLRQALEDVISGEMNRNVNYPLSDRDIDPKDIEFFKVPLLTSFR